MKRFFCTTCKKVRRVRVYPSNVIGMESERPQDRIGECVWHKSGTFQLKQFKKERPVKRVTVESPAKSRYERRAR